MRYRFTSSSRRAIQGARRDLGAPSDLITVLGYKGPRVLRDVSAPTERAGGVRNGSNGNVSRTDAAGIEIEHPPEAAQKREHAPIRVGEPAVGHQRLAEQNSQTQVLLPPMTMNSNAPKVSSVRRRKTSGPATNPSKSSNPQKIDSARMDARLKLNSRYQMACATG